METLNKDFSLDRYGLHARLVTEADAEFIVRIRTDKRVGSFLHSTSTDVEKQREWIRDYKKREAEGKEYYFFFSYGDQPVGVGRIIVFNELYANSGSWVCSPDASLESVVASNFVINDIIFEQLKIDICLFEVVKENKSVWKFHEQKGAIRYYESDSHYFYHLCYSDYKPKRDKVVRLMGL